MAGSRTVAAWSIATSGRHCWSVLPSTCASTSLVLIAKQLLAEFPGAEPTPLSPWGLRLPTDSKIDTHPAFGAGLVEVQDEGSQLIALACQPRNGLRILDLCAGAGGKALALAASAPEAEILASDTNRDRLSKLRPRAERAGARIETLLLNTPNELDALSDWRESADVVLVDAPCSGSGTWRRNPEGRWRLTPTRLDRVLELQSRLLGIAADCVRPGGQPRLCRLLAAVPRRGRPDRSASFRVIHRGLVKQLPLLPDVWMVLASC